MSIPNLIPGLQLRVEPSTELRASVSSKTGPGDLWYTDLDIYRMRTGVWLAVRVSVRDGVSEPEYVIGSAGTVRQFLGGGPLSRMALRDAFSGFSG